MTKRTFGTIGLALLASWAGSCGEPGPPPSPSVRPSNVGSMQVLPIQGWLWSDAERTGLDTAPSIDLAAGASSNADQPIWHTFGTPPNVSEIAWNLVSASSTGDKYAFQVRTYDQQGQAKSPAQIEVLYTGTDLDLWETSSYRFELRYELPVTGQ